MNSMAGKTVLITGATGRQGGAVIRHMLDKGWTLRALALNPSSDAARVLARQGIDVVRGDFDDPASLERAADGVYGLYSVQDFWSVGARREVRQGKNVADAIPPPRSPSRLPLKWKHQRLRSRSEPVPDGLQEVQYGA